MKKPSSRSAPVTSRVQTPTRSTARSSIHVLQPSSAGSLDLIQVWSAGPDATPPSGYTHLTTTTVAGRTLLVAYARGAAQADAYELTDGPPWIRPVACQLNLPGGPWDNLESFVLGNDSYLLTYRTDTGTFGFFHLSPDLTASPPFTFAMTHLCPSHGFTTVKPFASLGLPYFLGYDFERGMVAAYSLAVVGRSTSGVPPLQALNVWYHQWAKGWTHFAFFQLGGANFFFKINVAKLNVNIDHIQDNPAAGTVEVGSWLQNQLPDALQINVVQPVPRPGGDPYFLTYLARQGETSVYRIHGDCQGWTRVGTGDLGPNVSQIASYLIGDRTFVLGYAA